MEQFSDFYIQVLQDSVSLAVLLLVLVGLYRLVNRFLHIMEKHLAKCCGYLKEIAEYVRTIATMERVD